HGSKIDAKKAPVESTASVTDTFDAIIAPKKVSQCKAIITPPNAKPERVFKEKLSFSFLNFKKAKIISVASNILYHTSGIASKEIKAPNTAVNPQINIIK